MAQPKLPTASSLSERGTSGGEGESTAGGKTTSGTGEGNSGEPAKKKAKAASAPTKPADKSQVHATPVCVICKKNDDRPMVHFRADPSYSGSGPDVHVHVFCGKVAAISTVNKMPEYEIMDTAAVRNKYGKNNNVWRSSNVVTAMSRTRSATDKESGKVYYLFQELEQVIAEEEKKSPLSNVPTAKKPRLPSAPAQSRTPTKTPVELLATGPAAARSAPPEGREDLDIRRRPCICNIPSCYSVLERWVQVGDDLRCGYVSLPNWSTKKTARAKVVNQFRELVFLNLLGDRSLASKSRELRRYVAFHHFETFMLLPGNKGLVEYIEPITAMNYALPSDYTIADGENKGKYLPSPRRPFPEIVRELEMREQQKQKGVNFAKPPLPVNPIPVDVPLLDPQDYERLNARIATAPRDYASLKARYEQAERALAIETKRGRDLGKELTQVKGDPSLVLDQSATKRLMGRISSAPRNYQELRACFERTEKELAIETQRRNDAEAELANTKKDLYRMQVKQSHLKTLIKELSAQADKF